MQLDEKKQVLAKNFLFRQLKAKDLGRVAKLALERHYDHGQIIFQKGQPEREKDIGATPSFGYSHTSVWVKRTQWGSPVLCAG
jgi:hypothetical protein